MFSCFLQEKWSVIISSFRPVRISLQIFGHVHNSRCTLHEFVSICEAAQFWGKNTFLSFTRTGRNRKRCHVIFLLCYIYTDRMQNASRKMQPRAFVRGAGEFRMFRIARTLDGDGDEEGGKERQHRLTNAALTEIEIEENSQLILQVPGEDFWMRLSATVLRPLYNTQKWRICRSFVIMASGLNFC